jgi:hypothetical protein
MATNDASGKKLPRLPPWRWSALERASAAPCGGGAEEKETTSWRGAAAEEEEEEREEREEEEEEKCLCKKDERARGDQGEPLRRGPHRASVVAAIVASATSSADAGDEDEDEASERSLRPTEWLFFI